MKNLVIFGGTGGLGKQLSTLLEKKYNTTSLGSKDVDITNITEVQNFFNKNEIDIVINLSGLNYDCFIHKYDEKNRHKVDDLIDTNIKGAINIMNCCLPQMRERGYGRIVLTSSVLAENPVISTGVYSGCKGFLDSMTKTVALENITKGITCNSIQLGYFDGGLTYKIPEDFRETIRKSIPMKRFGRISELEQLINMLINVEYITGTNIKCNGGVDF